jgi:hypothetical protein
MTQFIILRVHTKVPIVYLGFQLLYFQYLDASHNVLQEKNFGLTLVGILTRALDQK